MAARSHDPSFAVLGLLATVGVLSFLSIRAPAPEPPGAGLERFSAGRAMRIVEGLAGEPRPVGSEAHGRARDLLVAELGAMGYRPVLQTGTRTLRRRRSGENREVELTNVLVRIPGSSGGEAVLLVAHYDSVSTGPGAGDDAVGVAALLETLRALRLGPAPRNDLIFLFDDGEELGLLGARLFAEEHPWMDDVRLVLNFDARGNGGPAVLFETGPKNGRLVAELARCVRRPVGTSLASAIYHRMPNDTDLTVFLQRGLPGLNFAFLGGASAYHAPFDAPADLHRGSLQHQGEYALALARRFGETDLADLHGEDAVFFNLGRRLVIHPASWSRPIGAAILLLVVAVLAWALRTERIDLRGLGSALLLVPSFAFLTALLTWLGWGLTRLVVAGLDLATGLFATAPERGNLLSSELTALGAFGLGGAVALALLAAVTRVRAEAPRRALHLAAAALVWWALLLALLLFFLPDGSHLAAWPLPFALAAFAILASGRESPLASAAIAANHAAMLPVLMPVLHLLVLVGSPSPWRAAALGASLVALGLVVAFPALWLMVRVARHAAPLVLAVLGLATLLASAVAAAAGM